MLRKINRRINNYNPFINPNNDIYKELAQKFEKIPQHARSRQHIIEYLQKHYSINESNTESRIFQQLVDQIFSNYKKSPYAITQFFDTMSAQKKNEARNKFPNTAMNHFKNNFMSNFWISLSILIINSHNMNDIKRFKENTLQKLYTLDPQVFIDYITRHKTNDNQYMLRLKNSLYNNDTTHVSLTDILPFDQEFKHTPSTTFTRDALAKTCIHAIAEYAQTHNNLHPFFADFILYVISITHNNKKINIISYDKKTAHPALRYNFHDDAHKYKIHSGINV